MMLQASRYAMPQKQGKFLGMNAEMAGLGDEGASGGSCSLYSMFVITIYNLSANLSFTLK